jgi:hypothetical protein
MHPLSGCATPPSRGALPADWQSQLRGSSGLKPRCATILDIDILRIKP